MKTLGEVTSSVPYPSWAREVSDDVRSGINVGALRARTAEASSIAPFDVILRTDSGVLVRLELTDVLTDPKAMTLYVRLPKVTPPQKAVAG